MAAAAPGAHPKDQPCYGCVEAAAADPSVGLPTSGHCECRAHYIPGEGLVTAYLCAYHGGQEADAEEWQWYDDPEEPHPSLNYFEYNPDYEYQNWPVGDSNDRNRVCLDRRKATLAAKDKPAEIAGWGSWWMATSERTLMPVYVVLFVLIACLLIAVAAINALTSAYDDGSATTIAGMPYETLPEVRLLTATGPTTTTDNSSYTTDIY
ncbi:uncharacterized protein [Dermacentor andersoni]|uniref:uncharacterized protein n=1 Tax=Dermacentor andersoni TaxID=34620 RepID=UPI002417DA10|nr:uncharacterized protein LOC126531244 [Dermacentor andersoni]